MWASMMGWVIALFCLYAGITTDSSALIIASGLFAIAGAMDSSKYN